MAFLSRRLKLIAHISHWLATLAFFGLILLAICLFVVPDFTRSIIMDNMGDDLTIAAPPSLPIVYAVLLVGSITLAVQLFVVWHMRALFGLYAEGEALSRACAVHISKVGLGLLVFPLTAVLFDMAASVLLTMGNPVGERELVLSFDSDEIAGALGGALLLLIGAAMKEATRQAEENRAFI